MNSFVDCVPLDGFLDTERQYPTAVSRAGNLITPTPLARFIALWSRVEVDYHLAPRRTCRDFEPASHQRLQATTNRPRTEDRARGDPEDGSEQIAVAATRDGEQHEMEYSHDEIRDAEEHPITAEGAPRCEGHDQHRRDRGEHRQSDGTFLGVEGIRQPSIRRPQPPEHAEQQQSPQETAPRRVVREEARHLRDGEDEDEVEEQFQGA